MPTMLEQVSSGPVHRPGRAIPTPGHVPDTSRPDPLHAPRWFVPVLVLVSGVLAVTGAAGALAGPRPVGVVYSPHPLAGLTFLVAGGLIVPRQPRNAVGWLFVGVGLVTGLVAVTAGFAQYRSMMWLNQWLPPLAYGLLPLALLRFPDGRLPGRSDRIVGWLGIVAVFMATAGVAWAVWIEPGIVFDRSQGVSGVAGLAFRAGQAGALMILATMVLAALALYARWRRSQGVARQQIKMLALGAAVVPVAIGLEILSLPGAGLLVALAVPSAAGAAVLRYRLFDIDLFINRTLVYLVLTLALVGLYVAVVGAVGAVVGQGWESPALAAALVAVAFGPLRERVQRAARRLLYGVRDDPYLAVSRLSQMLEPAAEPGRLPARLVDGVADALRLPYVGLEVADAAGGSRQIAGSGDRGGTRCGANGLEHFPMVHNGLKVGSLVALPRTLGGEFTTQERALLSDLARQAGVALHAMRLTADLQASRTRLVHAREDERRRLRRELHDGMGPDLAGAVMQLSVLRDLFDGGADDPHVSVRAGAVAGIDGVEQILRGCLDEVRRIVENLRPASLDHLGLVVAIRRTASGLAGPDGPRIIVRSELADRDLPAAVEVAAYRIVGEALTNAVRHSGARSIWVVLGQREHLEINVFDDGNGQIRPRRDGLGLTSMRERAEELGGDLQVAGGPAGAHVSARIPLQGCERG